MGWVQLQESISHFKGIFKHNDYTNSNLRSNIINSTNLITKKKQYLCDHNFGHVVELVDTPS